MKIFSSHLVHWRHTLWLEVTRQLHLPSSCSSLYFHTANGSHDSFSFCCFFLVFADFYVRVHMQCKSTESFYPTLHFQSDPQCFSAHCFGLSVWPQLSALESCLQPKSWTHCATLSNLWCSVSGFNFHLRSTQWQCHKNKYILSKLPKSLPSDPHAFFSMLRISSNK